MILATKYGPFSTGVRIAGAIITATAAFLLLWRGRARWEPSEEDISKGPQRVAILAAAIPIALLFVTTMDGTGGGLLEVVAISLGISTVLFLILYSILTAALTYDKVVSVGDHDTKTLKIIGGLWLTPRARGRQKKGDLTVQQMYRGAAYDEDKVWPRLARALAKALFVLAYIVFVAGGTVALAAIAFRVGIAVGTEKPGPLAFGQEKADAGVTLRSFVRSYGVTSPTFTAPQLRLRGYVVIVDAQVRGERGQRLPVHAGLFDAHTEKEVGDLADPSVPFVSEGALTPHRVSDEVIIRVWVQEAGTPSGKVYARITIGNAGGGILAAHRVTLPPVPG